MKNEFKFPFFLNGGKVEMTSLTTADIPDDFWHRVPLNTNFVHRKDLEIRVSKVDEAIVKRLLRQVSKKEFFLPDEWHKGLEDKGEYLRYRAKYFDEFGNYEHLLIRDFLDIIRARDKDEYWLKKIIICVYMRKKEVLGNPCSANVLKPLDIKRFSAYTDVVGAILNPEELKVNFDGIHCEYTILGHDRCSLGLLIESKKDNWAGKQEQVNFHIALYQMPGTISEAEERDEIRDLETDEVYLLDSIILNGDMLSSFDELKTWVHDFNTGYCFD